MMLAEENLKNIAGTGMDPNVTGTGPCTPFITEGGITSLRTADSFHTEHLWVSEYMREEAQANKRVEILSDPEEWPFDKDGNLW